MDGGGRINIKECSGADLRRRVLSTLASSGQIKNTDAVAILALIEKAREPFDLALTRLGLVTETELAACLAAVTGAAIPGNPGEFAPLSDQIALNCAYFRRNRVLPAERNGDLCALTPDPTNIDAKALHISNKNYSFDRTRGIKAELRQLQH